MTQQLNVRLPETTISRINELAKAYGSQAKVLIAAIEHLHTKDATMKKYYAGYNSYGASCTYDSDGWSVHVFGSKAERDAWVEEDDYPNGNPTRETITEKDARRAQPNPKHWITM